MKLVRHVPKKLVRQAPKVLGLVALSSWFLVAASPEKANAGSILSFVDTPILSFNVGQYPIYPLDSINPSYVVKTPAPVKLKSDKGDVKSDTNDMSIKNDASELIMASKVDTVSMPTESIIPDNDTIWEIMSRDFKLDHSTQLAEVQEQIKKIQKSPHGLKQMLKDAGPYIHYIFEQTKAHGLPAELALLPLIESSFNPHVRSHVGALGLWQLMPKTATELGVTVKKGYDGRRDVMASTKAALRYLVTLGKYFSGNWYLAIGAYNCGPGRMKSTARRNGSTNFWALSLPKETKQYVPKLLAVAAVVKDPARYGITLPEVGSQPYFTKVTMEKPVNLATVASSTGVSLKTLEKLNPDYQFHKHMTTTKDGAYTLLVPIEQAQIVAAKFNARTDTVVDLNKFI